MLSFRVDTEVDVPAETAFSLLAELRNRPSWDTYYQLVNFYICKVLNSASYSALVGTLPFWDSRTCSFVLISESQVFLVML